MTLSAPMRCSALAEQLDEPLAGTVEQRVRWLLVEDRSPWGTDAVGDVLGPTLAAALKAGKVRAVLVRRREGDPASDALRRVTLVDTDAACAASWTIGSVAELDVTSIVSAPLDDLGSVSTDPVFLVCSNGKRDACCAVRGRLLLTSLAGEHAGRTWECTHLGGHRFAASLICLPHGIVYGRVPPADGPRLAAEYLAGRLDPGLLRGRSAWHPAAQAAEVHLRLGEQLTAVDAVTLGAADVTGDHATVTLLVDGTPRVVSLRSQGEEPPRPISCRSDELERPVHWTVV